MPRGVLTGVEHGNCALTSVGVRETSEVVALEGTFRMGVLGEMRPHAPALLLCDPGVDPVGLGTLHA
jgi:hypothetical protein